MALALCRECGQQVSSEAAHCPHCGASDPAGVQAAKKTAAEARNSMAIGGCLFAVLFVAAIGAIIGSNSKPSNDQASSPSEAVAAPIDSSAKVRAESIMKHTPVARITQLPTSVLNSVIGAIHDPDSTSRRWYTVAVKESDRRTIRDRIDGIAAAAASECHSPHTKSVTNLVAKHADWDDRMIASVACDYVSVGMTAEQLRASWGRPEEINRTVVGASTSDQWVYGYNFVYVEDGVVTSYQVSH